MAALIRSPAKNKAQTRATMPDFRVARTCYAHLAGKLAIEIVSALLKQNILITNIKDFALTENDAKWLGEFGIEAEELKLKRRAFAAKCLDWSEREHPGGRIGSGIFAGILEKKMARQIKYETPCQDNFGRQKKFRQII